MKRSSLSVQPHCKINVYEVKRCAILHERLEKNKSKNSYGAQVLWVETFHFFRKVGVDPGLIQSFWICYSSFKTKSNLPMKSTWSQTSHRCHHVTKYRYRALAAERYRHKNKKNLHHTDPELTTLTGIISKTSWPGHLRNTYSLFLTTNSMD